MIYAATSSQSQTKTTDAALIDCVKLITKMLYAFVDHRAMLDNSTVELVNSNLTAVERRLKRKDLYVCVVGEKKAGKSTFLNALLGERVLGSAVREYTGTITQIRRSRVFNAIAHLKDGNIENFATLFPDLTEQFLREFQDIEKQHVSTTNEHSALLCQIDPAAAKVADAEADLAEVVDAQQRASIDADQAARALVAAQDFELACKKTIESCRLRLPFFLRSSPSAWSPARLLIRPLMLVPKWRARRKELQNAEQDLAHARKSTADATARLASTKAEVDTAQARTIEQTAAHRELKSALDRLQNVYRDADSLLSRLIDDREKKRTAIATHQTERKTRFLEYVRELTDTDRRAGSVLEIQIEFPARFLPENIVVIDTPGVNTDNVENQKRAWKAIQENADGCILVSDLQQPVSQSTKDFITGVRDIVQHIILVLTKMDRALQNAEDVSDVTATEQVEEARRVGVREFAKKVGRRSDEVLSVAVAAQPVLATEPDEAAIRRFETEASKIFNLLNRERALMLAYWAANILKKCIPSVQASRVRAEDAYRKCIETLESQRIPSPEDFCRRQMDSISSAIENAATGVLNSAKTKVDLETSQLVSTWHTKIWACRTKDELKALISSMQNSVNAELKRSFNHNQQLASVHAGKATQQLKIPLLDQVRERYRIAQKVSHSARAFSVDSALAKDPDVATVALETDMRGAFKQFEDEQNALGTGGALAGAAIGTFIFPGVGTAVGAAIGWMASYLTSLDSVQQECETHLCRCMGDAKTNFFNRLEQSQIANAIRTDVEQSLHSAVEQFRKWIELRIEKERKRIEAEHVKLRRLEKIGANLQTLDCSIHKLMEAAKLESVGLCR